MPPEGIFWYKPCSYHKEAHPWFINLMGEFTIKALKPSDHPVNLNDDWSQIAKTRCLQRLKEGNLLGALFWAHLMIKFKISCFVKKVS